MNKSAFYSISVPHACRVLGDVHADVVRNNGRVELHSSDVTGASIIISKQELQSIEKALEFLSDTDGVEQVRLMLKAIGASE